LLDSLRHAALHRVAIAAAVALPHACWAAESACLATEEREWLKKTYAEYASRYDPPTFARQFLEVSEATQSLKDQVSACRKTQEPGAERCALLRQQLDEKLREQGLAAERLNAALGMQSYLDTLQFRLERPPCQK
jgi:hypothetical protein